MNTTPSAFTHTTTSWWHSPTITVARFTLRSYMGSGWILGDIVFVWLLYAAFFLEFGGNVSYFFSTTGQGLGVLAILGTIVIVKRSMNARLYLPLARLTSRSAYLQGLMLATCVLRIPSYLLMLLLGGGYHTHAPSFGIQGASFGNLLLGSIGLLINCIIVSILTIVLSLPITTRRIQIIFLAWLAAVLYVGNNANPYLSIIHFPIAPIAVCFSLGTTTIGWYELYMVLVAIGYIVALVWLASYWFSRRDLIFS